MSQKVSFFWFRRDLRLRDNVGLHNALKGEHKVIPLFIFDREILDKLEDPEDARVQFIHRELDAMKKELKNFGSNLLVHYGKPENVWEELIKAHDIVKVHTNRDYEPYARKRDGKISDLLDKNGIAFCDYKDHVIFDRDEILKDDGDPYVVYTPFSRKWLAELKDEHLEEAVTEKYFDNFLQFQAGEMPTLNEMGFKRFEFEYPDRNVDAALLKNYGDNRDIPARKGTSRLSVHLRFGTVSIRELTKKAQKHSKSWLNELIWRNFYQVIIWQFPDRIENAFRSKYDSIPWRNDEDDFRAWCQGKTGYPIVDAGMREL
ncbi:MAG: deoxyribodipyrimidine photo-lyase, partial [Flavobacteriales bacterium]|nr:deoxyribodipyrimidine photo-lyase [Flavobacteriales bacterium]